MARLRMEDVMAASIMQEHGRPLRAIARDMGVPESTLRYRVKRFREGAEDGRRRQPERCAPWDSVIMPWVERNILALKRPRPIKELHELLVCEHGYTGSYKSVVRYVRRRVPRPRLRSCRRAEVRPGTQGQADWFTVPVWVDELGGLVKLSAFVIALSFSRMWAVVWSTSQDMLSWIHCHNEALRRLGGVPLTIRIDNLKTGVSSGAGPTAVLNAGYESYARQMGYVIDPARAGKGSDKGKVERRGQDVKRIPVQAGDRFSTVAELQAVTDRRVLELSGRLLCPVTGKSIKESWQFELEHLHLLPQTLPEPFDVQVARTVQRDHLVNFEHRQYEVPTRYIGREVTVRGCAGEVRIYSRDGRLLRSYPRGTDCRILLDRTQDDFEGDDRVQSPTPFGRIARTILLDRSWEWEAASRPIDEYQALVGQR